MSITRLIVTVLIYFVIGCLISVPYTFLANGNLDNFMLTAWLAPVGSVLVLLAYIVGKAMSKDRHRRQFVGSWLFWIVATYFCLPIILNGVSLLLKLMGYNTVGHYVFACRYSSLYACFSIGFVAVVVYCMTADGVTRIWRLHTNRTKTSTK